MCRHEEISGVSQSTVSRYKNCVWIMTKLQDYYNEVVSFQSEIDRSTRDKFGIFQTTPDLAEELAEVCFDTRHKSVCDIASGAGMLIAAYLFECEKNGAGFPEVISNELNPVLAQQQSRLLKKYFGIEIEVSSNDALISDPVDCDLAVINPPFCSGTAISTKFGDDYYKEVKKICGIKGRSDIAAGFLTRCENAKTVGIVATNTIAQGMTRRCGLARMIDSGFEIDFARTDVVWGGDAKVTVNLVKLCRN